MSDVNDIIAHLGMTAGAGGVAWTLGSRLLTMLEKKWDADLQIKKDTAAAALGEAKATADELRATRATTTQMFLRVINILGKQAEQGDTMISELRGINSLDLPRRSAPPEHRP